MSADEQKIIDELKLAPEFPSHKAELTAVTGLSGTRIKVAVDSLLKRKLIEKNGKHLKLTGVKIWNEA